MQKGADADQQNAGSLGRRGVIAGCNALNITFDEPQQWRALGLPSGIDNSRRPFKVQRGM